MSESSTQAEVDELRSALRASHERLARTLGSLSEEEVRGPSYDDDWTIAQVASHLGSGAEIFDLIVGAGLRGEPSPDAETSQKIWARWDAKEPADQVADALRSDAGFVDHLDALDDAECERWRLDLYGAERSLDAVLRMRLGEHALHTWDIAVMVDLAATVDAEAAALVMDDLGQIVERSAAPPDDPLSVVVRTTAPSRQFRLELAPGGARLEAAADAAGDEGPALDLPAEAFVRLVYGRLDAAHTPTTVVTTAVDLDTLRRAFPGV